MKLHINFYLKLSVCLIAAFLFISCATKTHADIIPTVMPSPTCTPAPTTVPSPTSTPAPDFYHVSGTNIVDTAGNIIQLKGIAMGNMIWSSLEPVDNDHNENSFRELAKLGFNSVRFYLSYSYFEEENNPYVYKENGFDWLEQNIAWAKKHGIKIIFNIYFS